jgi:serine/threonine protein kinase/uncharacterized protein YraI
MAAHKELRGALPIGSRLLGYEIAAVLGQGSFGITYHARDPKLARDVAIKEYLPTDLALREGDTTVVPRSTEVADDFTWGRERFLEEARTLAKFDGTPAVVRVIDFLEANGTAYMVMALVRGETLEWRIRKHGPLTPSMVERLLAPLLDGLQCVHETGFLHRDIKPANIIVDGKGQPTLIDFGAARAAMAKHSAALTAIFTPGYAAPEQFTSGKQGPWTDIYALSATLCHAITGEVPPNAFDRLLDDTYKPLVDRSPPDWPRGLLAGIDAGLALRAVDRPQSVAAWRPILVETAAPGQDPTVVVGQPSVATEPPATQASKQKKTFSLWVAVGLLAFAVLAGGGYLAVEENSRRTQQAVLEKAVEEAKVATAEAQRQKAEQELARLRAEEAARLKADQEAAQRREAEEAARRKAEADLAAKLRQEKEEAQRKDSRLSTEAPPPSVERPQPPSPAPQVGIFGPLSIGFYSIAWNIPEGYQNVRTGPGQKHPVVGRIPAGTKGVEVGSCRPADDGMSQYEWCQVNWNRTTGWTSRCCLNEQVTQGTYSIPTNMPQGYQNLRSGPGQRHAVITRIPAGVGGVEIGPCRGPDDNVSRYDWCEANWNGQQGWISSCCLVKSGETLSSPKTK